MAIATINPFTGKTEQTFDAHSEEEVERRIAAAQDAFEALRSTTFAQRSEWMLAGHARWAWRLFELASHSRWCF